MWERNYADTQRKRVSGWGTASTKTLGQDMLSVFEKKQWGWCSWNEVCEEENSGWERQQGLDHGEAF